MTLQTEVFEGQFKVTEEGISELLDKLGTLTQVASGITKSFSKIKLPGISGADSIATTANTVKAGTDSIKQSADQIQRTLQVIDQQSAIDNLSEQFERVADTADLSTRSLGRTFSDVRNGLTIIQQGGSALDGLRQAFTAVGDTTSRTARAFDSLDAASGRINRLRESLSGGVDANERLRRSSEQTSEEISRFTSALGTQGDILKEIAQKEVGLSGKAFRELDFQVRKVEGSFKNVQKAIQSGSKVSDSQLASIGVEVQQLEQTFQELTARGIIPAGSATEEAFKQIVEGAKVSQNATRRIAAGQNTLVQKAKAAQAATKAQTQSIVRQGNVFKRITFSVGSFFNVFKTNNTAIDQTVNNLQEVDQQVREVTRSAQSAGSVLKGAFLGTFTGVLASNAVAEALGFIKDEFFAANDAVQNFRITIANMLKGVDVAVADVQEGVESFIRDVVARTPFELTDAFEAFQSLLVSGFDPQAWLTPVADAAAAVNKPMDQLIGALAKLQVGAKGAGIDMLRDFGIPVNQVGAFIDAQTGKLLKQDEVLNENINLYDLSAQELANLGVEFRKLEFDKQGALINDVGDSMNILNGFLTQNATFAGAAESRSRSLSGVISNLKDFITNLALTAGQPIFESLTVSGARFLEILGGLEPVLNQIALVIGTTMSSALNILSGDFSFFTGLINSVATSLDFASQLVGNIIAGNWTEVWLLVGSIVAEGLNATIEIISSFAASAYDWGQSFISEIANGIIDAANSILADAVSFVGSIMSSFLEPGSPPKKGPLRTIDKWGKGLGTAFAEGFGETNLTPIQNFLTDISSTFEKFSGEVDTSVMESTATGIGQELEAISDRLQVGLLSETEALEERTKVFNEYAERVLELGEKDLAAFLVTEATAGPGEQAAKEIEKQLDAEVAAIEKRAEVGIITEEQAGQQIVDLNRKFAEEALKAGDEGLAESLAQRAKQLEEQQQAAADSQFDTSADSFRNLADLEIEEAERGAKGAGSARSAAAGKAGRAARKAIEKEQETVEQRYQRELALIEQKRELGVISEKEYIQALLKIEKQYVDGSIKDGVVAGLETHVSKIKELELRLGEFKVNSKGIGDDITENFEIPTAGEILKGFVEDAPAQLAESGKQAGLQFVRLTRQTITERLQTAIRSAKNGLLSAVSDVFQFIGDKLRTIITPENFPIFAAITGLLASVAGSGIASVFSKIAGLVSRVVAPFTRFVGVGLRFLPGLLKLLVRFSLIGGLILTIFLEWDTLVLPIIEDISSAFGEFFESLKLIAGILTDAFVGGGAEGAESFVTSMAKSLGLVANSAIAALGSIKLLVKSVVVAGLIFAFETAADVINNFIDNLGGVDQATKTIRTALIEISSLATGISEGIFEIVSGLITFDTSKIQGGFQQIFDAFASGDFSSLSSVGSAILDSIFSVGSNLGAFIASFFSQIVALLPQPVQDILTQIVIQFEQARIQLANFFSQGRLGGELIDLFAQLREAFAQILPTLQQAKPIFVAIGVVIAVLAGIVVNVFVSALQALADSLPFIERILAGVVTVITGLVDVVTGGLLILQAALAAIFGDTEQAQELLSQGIGQFAEGIGNIFAGLLQVIVNAGLAILSFIFSFVTSFVANVLQFIPGFETAATAIVAFRDLVLESFVDLADRVFVTISQLGTLIQIGWEKITNIVIGIVIGFVSDLIASFQHLYDTLVGNSIVTDLVTDIIDLLLSLPAKALEIGQAIVGNLVSAISSGASQLLESAGSLFGGLFGGGGEGEEAGTGINAGASVASILSSGPQILQIISSVTSAITAFFSQSQSWAAGLATLIENLKLQFVTTIALMFDEVLPIFELGFTTLVELFTLSTAQMAQIIFDFGLSTLETLSSVADEITALWDSFWTGTITETANGANRVTEIMFDMIIGIQDAFERAYSKFVNVGKNIILGIIEGLEKNANKVYNFIIEIARQAVERMKSAFGIASPATEFTEIGEDLMDGLLLGLENGEGQLNRQLDQLGADMNSRLLKALEDSFSAGQTSSRYLSPILFWNDRFIQENFNALRELFRTNQGTLENITALIESTFLGKQSPAKDIEKLARALVKNTDNIEKVFLEYRRQASAVIQGFLDTGRQLASIARGFEKDLFSGLDKRLSEINDELKIANETVGDLDGSTYEEQLEAQRDRLEEINKIWFNREQQLKLTGKEAFALSRERQELLQQIPALEQIISLEAEQNELTEERLRAERELAELAENERKLSFLQRQLDLLKLVQENEVDVSEIFEGLEFGLDAPVSDIIEATNRALEGIIAQVNDTLEISSPSQVMAEAGENAMLGLQEGINKVVLSLPLEQITNLITPMESLATLAERMAEAFTRVGDLSTGLAQTLGGFNLPGTGNLALSSAGAINAPAGQAQGAQITNIFNNPVNNANDRQLLIRDVINAIRLEIR